jgi:chemotaxis response regulator CheB
MKNKQTLRTVKHPAPIPGRSHAKNRLFPILGIGGSAGSFKALERFFYAYAG